MSHFIMVHHIVSAHSDLAELLPQPSCCLGSEYYRTKYLHRRSNVVYSLSPCTIQSCNYDPTAGQISTWDYLFSALASTRAHTHTIKVINRFNFVDCPQSTLRASLSRRCFITDACYKTINRVLVVWSEDQRARPRQHTLWNPMLL